MSIRQTFALAELVEITSSKRVFMADYVSSGVPFWRGKEVIERANGKDVSTELFITENRFEELRRKSGAPVANDILLTSVGTLGVPYLVSPRDKFYFKDGNLTWFRNFSDALLPRYLLYWMRSSVGQSAFEQITIGSTQKALTIVQLKKLRISLPNLEEQSQVVEVLGALDDKIELNRRMNETLEAMAQAIFRDWFVDFGPTRRKLEGATDPVTIMGGLVTDPARAQELADLFPATLGDDGLPEGWNGGTVADLVEFNPKEPLRKGVVAPYSDMSSLPTQGPLAEAPVPRAFGSGMRFRNGDALLARITPCLENGKAAFVDFLPDDQPLGWGSTEFFVMRTRQGVPRPMSYLLARDDAFRSTAIASMTGTSGRQRAQVDRLENFPIALPVGAVLKNFGKIVEPMFAKMSANGRENQTLAATRDLLLPKLMSGEIRVSEGAAA